MNKVSDVKNAYDQIVDFLNNTTERTLLIYGIADEKKHISLLKALNAQGKQRGLVFLIHTTKDGMKSFFRWAAFIRLRRPPNMVKQ